MAILDVIGWKQHSYAYKFVFLSLAALFVAILAFWGNTIGLFGHGLNNFNVQDEFGDVCAYTEGPEDLAGVEDMTIVENNVFYFAHPYRRAFGDKPSLARLADHLNLNPAKFNTVGMLLPQLPEVYRIPRIFVTDVQESAFPLVDVKEVQVEGFDLKIYHEFYPMGADSYIDPVTKKQYINVIFMNRIGHNVAQFEVVAQTNTEIDASTFNTKVKLVLRNVMVNSLWTFANAIAMVSDKEFYITNFLTKSPYNDEFGALVELITLARKGSVLHCATEDGILPVNPISYEMPSERGVRPHEQVPEIVETLAPYPDKNNKDAKPSLLYCYPLISGLGQTNGIAVHLKNRQLAITGGLARAIAIFELGTHDFLQTIPVPVGVDNLKFDPDTNDLYYGLNPSMLAVGKLIGDIGAKAPNAVYRLKAQSVQYDKNELLRKQTEPTTKQPKSDTDIANIDLSHLDEIEEKNAQYKQQQQQQQKQLNDNSVLSEGPDWFHYFQPVPVPVYIDTEPVIKQTAPTALPIPKKYTSGKVKGMPDYKLFISGSIYSQGVEVCRVINSD